MKSKLIKNILIAFFISTIVAIISELIEAKLGLDITGAVLLSILLFFIGILYDRYQAKKEFDIKVMKIVLELASNREKGILTAGEVQKIMKYSIKEVADLLQQHKYLDDKPKVGDKKISLKCQICKEDHNSDKDLKCTNCLLDADKWSYLNTELSKNNTSCN